MRALCGINIFYENSMCMRLLHNYIMKFPLEHFFYNLFNIVYVKIFNNTKIFCYFFADYSPIVVEFKTKMLRSFDGSNIGKMMRIMLLLPDPSDSRKCQNITFVRVKRRVHMRYPTMTTTTTTKGTYNFIKLREYFP